MYFDVSIGLSAAGRMEFEVFQDTTPKTAKNFIELCRGSTKGTRGNFLTYKNSIFHRVISGFMAQGGDFERFDGTGGESIYGRKFADENFVRKHVGRGLLSMANAGRNTNGSQFFITFKSTPFLDGKHVVFGKLVSGMNILDAIERTPTNPNNDRPRKEIRITGCGVVEPKAEAKKPAQPAAAAAPAKQAQAQAQPRAKPPQSPSAAPSQQQQQQAKAQQQQQKQKQQQQQQKAATKAPVKYVSFILR